MLENNQKIPEGWSVKKLEDCFSFLKTPSYSRAETTDSGEVRYIHYGDIHTKYHLHVCPTDIDIFVSAEQARKGDLLKTGDLILLDASEDYEGTTKCIELVDIKENDKVISGLHTLALRDNTKNFANGFRAYITSIPFVKDLFWKQVSGFKVYGVSKDNLKKLKLIFPPLAEQEKIAGILSCWDDGIEKLSALIEKKKIQKKALMQKLLTGKVRLFKTSPLAGEVADLSAGEGLDNQQSESIQNKKINNTLAYRQDCPLTSPLAGEVADLSAGEGFDYNDNIKISSHRMYQPYIKEFSRDMRKNSTKAENLLWQKIRNGQLGFKFRRQHQIDNKYIADFVCLEKRLIIELDGGQHNDRPKDKDRTLYLENNNFKVIRFWDNEILQNIDGCLEILLKEISLLNNPSPCPSPARGEGISATYSNPLPQGARKDVECSLDTHHQAQECHPLPQGARKEERFSQPWKKFEFETLFYTEKGIKSKQIQTKDYKVKGKYPIIDQGQKEVTAFCNDANKLYNNVPVIVFGDHTRILKFIQYPFIIGADGTQLLKTNDLLLLRFGFYLLCNTKIKNLGYSRHMSLLKEKIFNLPSDISEQQAIADVLSTADDEIDLLNKKLTLFKEQKKGLMQQLLTGNIRVKVN